MNEGQGGVQRVEQAFEQAHAQGRAALVIYLCAGDPSPDATPALIAAASRGGADVIELGVPFSDPTADGATLQRASERALQAGTTLGSVLSSVAKARETVDTPIILFGYYNPILAYGEKRLVTEAGRSGIDGMLTVDLPPEESQPLRSALSEASMAYVPLVAPTTHDARVRQLVEHASGFVYYVSLTGVTGSKDLDIEETRARLRWLKGCTSVNRVVGFGIKSPSDVAAFAKEAEGVVVGSAVVQRIAENASDPAPEVERFIASLRAATQR